MAQSTNEAKNATLYASSGLPLIRMIGVVSTDSPSRCSENAVAPCAGKNCVAFHHGVVSGRTRAFQDMIQTLSKGSPGS